MMGFTSGDSDAGSDHSPSIKLDLTNHNDGEITFPGNDGDDMVENKGDLWKIPISHFSFNGGARTSCGLLIARAQ